MTTEEIPEDEDPFAAEGVPLRLPPSAAGSQESLK